MPRAQRRRIYFAAPVSAGRDDVAVYDRIINELRRFGEVLTPQFGEPSLGTSGEPLPAHVIRERELEWIRRCQAFIAEISTPSLGVGYQLALASQWQRPVLCLYRPDPRRPVSKMIAGDPNLVHAPYEIADEIPGILGQFFEVLEILESEEEGEAPAQRPPDAEASTG